MPNPEVPQDPPAASAPAHFAVKAVLTVFLFLQVAGLCFSLWSLWPEKIPTPAMSPAVATSASPAGENAAAQPPAKVAVSKPATEAKDDTAELRADAPLGRTAHPEKPLNERDLLLLVMLAGALGGSLHGLYSICDYLGNRRFDWAWTVWYLVRAPVGAAVATVLYLALRGGFAGSSGPESLNLYGITALAALAGMFNRPAVTKLAAIAEQIFSKPPPQDGSLQSPRPTVTKVAPAHLTAGSTGAKVVLHGKDFVKGLSVLIDGVAQKAVWKSATEAELLLPDAVVAQPRKMTLVVRNPEPSLGESTPVTLEISPKS